LVLRTALCDFLLAKKLGGAFVLPLRPDVKRTVPGAEQEIMDGLRWLGLPYDERPDVGGRLVLPATERQITHGMRPYQWKAGMPIRASARRSG
jgi:glutamyl/glutaminyl-tRNA synthetase